MEPVRHSRFLTRQQAFCPREVEGPETFNSLELRPALSSQMSATSSLLQFDRLMTARKARL